jgi:1-deoxy-D-xylulose-5-phosphate reductoisomerase
MRDPVSQPRRLLILGCTGSIGTQTLRVLESLAPAHARGGTGAPHGDGEAACPHGPSYQVVGLAAGRSAEALFEQAAQLGVKELALSQPLPPGQSPPPGVRLRTGPDAAERLVREVEADVVMAAIVGAAGMPATLAAIELGRTVLLANKETLVAAGELAVSLAHQTGARLLPVDSEHSAVWQALAARAVRCGGAASAIAGHDADPFDPASPLPLRPPVSVGDDVARITLTASGGALRDWPLDRIEHATPEQALAHPNWSMGAKITIDSASLMNKAFELVEARWLFGVGNDRLDAVIHPQSIVHAIVDFADGSSVAQIGRPTMLTPIQYALTFPGRAVGLAAPARLAELGRLDFSPPDPKRFPALGLGWTIIERAGLSGAIVNAANERAIAAFLDHQIPFGGIARLAAAALEALAPRAGRPIRDLGEVLEADAEARLWVERAVGRGSLARRG